MEVMDPRLEASIITASTTLIAALFRFLLSEISKRNEKQRELNQKTQESRIKRQRESSLQLIKLIALLDSSVDKMRANLYTLLATSQEARRTGVQASTMNLQPFEITPSYAATLYISIDFPELLEVHKRLLFSFRELKGFHDHALTYASSSINQQKQFSIDPINLLYSNWQEKRVIFLLKLIERTPGCVNGEEDSNDDVIACLRSLVSMPREVEDK